MATKHTPRPSDPDDTLFSGAEYLHLKAGDTVVTSAAAPGIGQTVYRITFVDSRGAWGHVESSTVRELRPSEVR